MSRILKTTIILSIILIGLVRLQPIWEKKPGGIWNAVFILLIAILFLWMVILVIKQIIELVKNRRRLNFKRLLPISIISIILIDILTNPFRINLDQMFGKVMFKACYEGTQNQSILKFREHGVFDLHSTGVFFSSTFYAGDYRMKNDTIFLEFRKEQKGLLSDTLIIVNDELFAIEKDTIIPTHYYLGDCKGLN